MECLHCGRQKAHVLAYESHVCSASHLKNVPMLQFCQTGEEEENGNWQKLWAGACLTGPATKYVQPHFLPIYILHSIISPIFLDFQGTMGLKNGEVRSESFGQDRIMEQDLVYPAPRIESNERTVTYRYDIKTDKYNSSTQSV